MNLRSQNMRSGVRAKLVLLLAAGGLVAGANSARAEDPASPSEGPLKDPFVLSLGTYVVSTNINAGLNGRSTNNPDVDFDQTFGGGGDFTRGRADALWRITPTQHLRFLYFKNESNHTRTLDRNVDWGDYQFQANASVTASTKFNAYELAYEYSFLLRPNYEIAGSFGVHYLDLGLKLSGMATLTDANGNVSPVEASTSNSNLPAPLPVIGLRGGWAATSHLYLDAQAQWFKFKYEGYDGNWSDLRANATWMFTSHFGAGLGYNRFHAHLNVTRASFNGNLGLGYQGLQAFVTASF
jgi:hypothetical protein